MEIKSKAVDKRINSTNVYLEMTFGEYLRIADRIKSNNELQRKRVRSSKTVYSLLKNDIKNGCVIPPLVLAISGDSAKLPEINDETMKAVLENSKILILDGLQRTYTLIDADREMQEGDQEKYKEFLDNILRVEIYVNINKFGILYRMLTLNTGQTPMSARHQIEMLYSDLLDTELQGIRLVTEKEGTANSKNNEFEFKCTVDGFNSYLTKDSLPLDRGDLLKNIEMMENMDREDVSTDLFKVFLEQYISIFNAFKEVAGEDDITKEEIADYDISDNPFAKNICKMFSTSQAFTGFGSAVAKMRDLGVISKLEDVGALSDSIKEININNRDWMFDLLIDFDRIKNESKRIGNSQRLFFHYFFRELLNPDSDSYLDLNAAVKNGYSKYLSQI